ncbi:MAG: hypothetical protein AB8H79_18250, partial [Myxococcota bacterium]
MTRSHKLLVSILGSAAAVGLAFGSVSSDQSVSVSSPPLTVDQPTTFTITVKNDGSDPVRATSVRLPGDWIRALEITETRPNSVQQAEPNMSGSYVLDLELVIAAKSSETIEIDAIPRLGGLKSGSFAVCFEDGDCESDSVSESIAGEAQKALELDVVVPESLTIDEAFEIAIVMKNNGTLDDKLLNFGLSEDVEALLDVHAITPEPLRKEDALFGGTTYVFERAVAAGEELRIVIEATPTKTATLDDHIHICVDIELLYSHAKMVP